MPVAVNVGSASVTIMPTMSGFTSKMNKGLSSAGTSAGSAFSKAFGKGADPSKSGILGIFRRSGDDAGGRFGAAAASGISRGGAALTGAVAGIASTLAGSLASAIGSLTGEMAAASDSAQKFESTLKFAGLDTSAIDALKASTQEYADATVYGLEDVRSITAQLAANGVKDYDRLAEAAGNLNAVAGGTADTYKSVGMVLTQTAGQGKLTTENWNQLADAIPGASGRIQEALLQAGAYTGNFRDAMEKGEISAREFNDALMSLGFEDAAVEAARPTSTFEGAMGELEAAAVGTGASVMDAFKPLVTGALSGAAGAVTRIGDAVRQTQSDLAGFEEEAGAVPTAADAVWFAVQNMGQAFGLSFEQLLPLSDGLAGLTETVSGFVGRLRENGAVQTFFDLLGSGWEVASNLAGAVSGLVGELLGVPDGADPAAAAADGLKSALDGAKGVVDGLADATAWLRDNASQAAPVVATLAGAFAAFRIVQGVSGFVSAFQASLGGVSAAAPAAASALGSVGGAAAMSAPQILAVGGAIALVGAGVLLASSGLALLSMAATQVAASGPMAAVAMVGMVGAIAGLAAGAAAVGPALTASAVGIGVFGAAVLAAGVGIGIATAGVALLAGTLPTVSAYGASAAAGLAALGAALLVVGPGALVAGAGIAVLGAGVVVAAAGVLAFSAAVVAAAAGVTLLGAGVTVLGAGVTLVAAGITLAAAGLTAMGTALPAVASSAAPAAAGLTAFSAAAAAASVGLLAGTPAMAAYAAAAVPAASSATALTAATMLLATGLLLVAAASSTGVSGLSGLASASPAASAGLAALAASAQSAAPGVSACAPALVAMAAACAQAASGSSVAAAALVAAAAALAALSAQSSAASASSAALAAALGVAGASATSMGSEVSALSGPLDAARSRLSSFAASAASEGARAASAIRSACAEMQSAVSSMRLVLPRIEVGPLPHFHMTGSFNAETGSVPSVGVSWYARGGYFSGPQVIGIGEGRYDEVALPLSPRVLAGIGEGIEATGAGTGEVESLLGLLHRDLEAIARIIPRGMSDRDFDRRVARARA